MRVLNELAVQTRAMRAPEQLKVEAWHSPFGLVEEYEYPRGRAAAMPVHAHPEMQICLSLDFPGRYAYRGELHDVPIGAVSILDSWEPHAASDPCDRDTLSHYVVLYVDPVRFRASIDLAPDAGVDSPVRTDVFIVKRFQAVYDSLAFGASVLEQDECYRELASAVMSRSGTACTSEPAPRALLRARDFIAAHASEPITLQDIASHADLSPWHFARAFRQRIGMPPHQFQLWMKLDRARRLLAGGMAIADVAQVTGFADQSHFTRCFKRALGTTPARYRTNRRRSSAVPIWPHIGSLLTTSEHRLG